MEGFHLSVYFDISINIYILCFNVDGDRCVSRGGQGG